MTPLAEAMLWAKRIVMAMILLLAVAYLLEGRG